MQVQRLWGSTVNPRTLIHQIAAKFCLQCTNTFTSSCLRFSPKHPRKAAVRRQGTSTQLQKEDGALQRGQLVKSPPPPSYMEIHHWIQAKVHTANIALRCFLKGTQLGGNAQ
uniref:Uncharacterized protein n=1 Tax=Sphaerodactylus townsendi TaxID=933632 RepID=A0ACB8EGI9_9SAUR